MVQYHQRACGIKAETSYLSPLHTLGNSLEQIHKQGQFHISMYLIWYCDLITVFGMGTCLFMIEISRKTKLDLYLGIHRYGHFWPIPIPIFRLLIHLTTKTDKQTTHAHGDDVVTQDSSFIFFVHYYLF